MIQNQGYASSALARGVHAARFPARWAVLCLVAVLGLVDGGSSDAAESEAAAQAPSEACPNGVCPGLGHAFYLPITNGFDPPSTGNDFFVDTRIGSCATQSPSKEMATRQFQSAESMEQLTRETMNSLDLNASFTTARLSAKASVTKMTGANSTTTQHITSTHMDITTATRNVDFKQQRDCFAKTNVDPRDVEDFESLPMIRPENVGQPSEWQPYEDYLQRIGSHILVRLQYGSRFQRWESSEESTADLLKTLKVKACVAVEGKKPNKEGWSVDGCAGLSDEQRRVASDTNSTSQQIALGGTEATRVALTSGVTKESIDAFIASGSKGDRPIRFGFKPVWDLWTQIYTPLCKKKGSKDCENLQRAYNLKIAYEGRLAIGCPEETSNNGLVYQSMAPAGKPNALGIQAYGCFAERTGCRSNLDCGIGGTFGVCYCFGASCFDQGESIEGTPFFRTGIRGARGGGNRQGVNNSCRFSPGRGSTCGCNTTWSGGLPRRDLFRLVTP